MTAAVMPAAMTGPVRRVDARAPRYRVEFRSPSQPRPRPFPFDDRAAALEEFDRLRQLNKHLLATGRYRLVLIDTEGRS